MHRQGARLEDDRELLRLGLRVRLVAERDLRAGAGRVDPLRVLRRVDRRVRADLVVEHDRERTRVAAVGAGAGDLTALRLVLRHLLEDLVALMREREEHDRLVVLVEVRADARRLQLLARHVRVLAVGREPVARVRAVLEEVVEGVARRRKRALVLRRADRRARAVARDDDRLRRHLQHLPALRDLAAVRVEQAGVPGRRVAMQGRRLAVVRGRRARPRKTVVVFFFLPVPVVTLTGLKRT